MADQELNEEQKAEMKKFMDVLTFRLEELRKTRPATECWVCSKIVNTWGVIMPEDGSGGLGLGKPEQGKARLVFFPVCKEHDLNDTEILCVIRQRLQVKIQTMLN